MNMLVTAGPTREFIDPVRFLSNPSTGKMGFAIAKAAVQLGAKVTLIAGPVSLPTPDGVRRIDVVSAREMLLAVRKALPHADALVMTAAVADWRPARTAAKKLKKAEMKPVLRLVRNPDILESVRSVKGRRFFIGFAAETGNPVKEAVRKCQEKGLDLVVANDVSAAGSGFGTDTNKATVVFTDGSTLPLPLVCKEQLGLLIAMTVQKGVELLKARARKARRK